MRRKLSKEAWLSLGLLILVVSLTLATAIWQSGKTVWPALSSYSTDSNGSRALRTWLERSGYNVADTAGESFSLPSSAGLLWMLEPGPEITSRELDTLDAWVEAGGSLVLAGEFTGVHLVASHYGFDLLPSNGLISTTLPQAPLFTQPPLDMPLAIRASNYLTTSLTTGFTPLFASQEGPLLVYLRKGSGRIFISTSTSPFSNQGLKTAGNPVLVQNLLHLANLGDKDILFDEWHHGQRRGAGAAAGFEDWLRTSSAGHALLFICVAGFLSMLLRGRSFGRPLKLAAELPRRPAVEHVLAMANLSRRAGHKADVLQQYRLQLRRQLGWRYHVNPLLSDADFVTALAAANPSLDTAGLLGLLDDLAGAGDRKTDVEFLRLAAQACAWIDTLPRSAG